MLQYKTTSIPATKFGDITKGEFRSGLTLNTCNKAIAPIGKAIEEEAKGGWTLHSIECLPQTIARKKSLMEKIFGWIPFVGSWIFPTMKQEVYHGVEVYMYVLVFVKES